MHLNIQDTDRFAKAVARAAASAPSKGDSSILETALLLQTEADVLTVVAANMSSHQLKLSVPAQVAVPGALLITGHYFSKLVSRLGNKPITLQMDTQSADRARLVITNNDSGSHKFDLFQGEPEDFPQDFELPPVAAVVDADALSEALKAVLIAATGVEQEIMFQGKNGTLHISAGEYIVTRSRMALTELNSEFCFAVPRSTLAGSAMPEFSGPVQIHVSETKVAFSQGSEHLLIRRLCPEPHMDYIHSMMDLMPIGRIVVSLAQLKNRAHIVASGKPNCVFRLRGRTTKELVIMAEQQGYGSSVMPIAIQGDVSGTTPEIKLDINLLEKAIKTIDGEDVVIDWVDTYGDRQSISLRLSNEANPEKRQTLLLPLQKRDQEHEEDDDQ